MIFIYYIIASVNSSFRYIKLRFRNVFLAILSLGLSVGAATAGQDALPSRVVRDSYRPAAPAAPASLDLGNFAGPDAPARGGSLAIRVGKLVVDGDAAPLPGIVARLQAETAGRTLSVADMFDLARRIEAAHAEAGFILVRVTVPPQKLVAGGTLHLRLVAGFIETVDADALPPRIRAAARARVAGLVGDRALTRDRLSRAVLIAGDLAGLTLHSTLAPGRADGGVRLILDGRHEAVTAMLAADNRLDTRLGGYSVSAAAAGNSLTGHGEQVFASWTGNRDGAFTATPRLRVLGAGVVLPLGDDGLTLTPEITWSESNPTPVAGSPQTRNTMLRNALRLAWPFARTPAQSVVLRGALETLEQRSHATAFATDLSLDRYAVLRGGVDAALTFPEIGRLTATLMLSQGLGGRDGGDAAASGVPLSRHGAGPGFTKLAGMLGWQGRLGPLGLTALTRGQTSFGRPLLAPEQLSLDGEEALSGFRSGSFSADEGLTARLELGWTQPLPGRVAATLSPYLYGAAGLGFLHDATAAEPSRILAGSLGAGLRGDIRAAPGTPPSLLWSVELSRSAADAGGVRYRNRAGFALAAKL